MGVRIEGLPLPGMNPEVYESQYGEQPVIPGEVILPGNVVKALTQGEPLSIPPKKRFPNPLGEGMDYVTSTDPATGYTASFHYNGLSFAEYNPTKVDK